MKARQTTADIVIIGGGIMGCCTAFHLARRSSLKILVLEKAGLAQASTGLSVGGIRQQFSHPANIRLSQESLRQLASMAGELGFDPGFHPVGYLFLTGRTSTWNDFRSAVETQLDCGVPVELLKPEDIAVRWPFLRTDDLLGGTFCSEDGFADPYAVAMAFAGAAREQGAEIREAVRVTAILSAGGRVCGVETTGGSITTPVCVNTAGPWAGEIDRMAGLREYIRPYRRQVFATRPFSFPPRPFPLVIDQDALFYFREEGPGLLLGMSDPAEPSSFSTKVDRSFLERVIEAAVRRTPRLLEAEILRGWAGLYAVTPDHNPIIGITAALEGYYRAVGFSGHGFQHGPAAGLILSDLILEGKTDFDIEPFAGERFDSPRSAGETRVV